MNSGDKLGPYEILSPIGAGGIGEVYRATIHGWGAMSPSRFAPSVSANGLRRKPGRLRPSFPEQNVIIQQDKPYPWLA
jgi:hypothetical protein